MHAGWCYLQILFVIRFLLKLHTYLSELSFHLLIVFQSSNLILKDGVYRFLQSEICCSLIIITGRQIGTYYLLQMYLVPTYFIHRYIVPIHIGQSQTLKIEEKSKSMKTSQIQFPKFLGFLQKKKLIITITAFSPQQSMTIYIPICLPYSCLIKYKQSSLHDTFYDTHHPAGRHCNTQRPPAKIRATNKTITKHFLTKLGTQN